jgi:lipoprotein-releasing system ATP-binding protein
MSNETMLQLTGVEKAYNAGKSNEVNVLNGIDLSVQKGEVVGLIAPSGAGKSTLLHIAGMLDTASSGSVTIAGNEATDLGETARTGLRRADVGFIYQFHHLLPEFSALENIILPQLANGVSQTEAEARAVKLLTSVGVEHRAKHRPAALSGGEQQRVAFCRALANKPALLLADEPTGNLDPATSALVFEALMKVAKEEGLAALIATHNMDLAAKMDRVLKLENGVLV